MVTAAASAAGGADAQPNSSDGSWFTKVVLPTALVLLVCNMDRICLSVAILPMAQEYGWPATVQVCCSRVHKYLMLSLLQYIPMLLSVCCCCCQLGIC